MTTTGILVTVRLKSTRLKRKALLPLGDRPLLGSLVSRLRETPWGDQVVIMTSDDPGDDELETFAINEDLPIFRGNPIDVLQRMSDASSHYGFDRILSITGDNPFFDRKLAVQLSDFHLQHDLDFAWMTGVPFGSFSYFLRKAAIDRACELKTTDDTEVWGDYFRKIPEFRCRELAITDGAFHGPDLRVTVDTDEDYRFVKAVHDHLGPGHHYGVPEIIRLCRCHPEITAINRSIEQKVAAPVQFRLHQHES